jgi:hypothetical protein
VSRVEPERCGNVSCQNEWRLLAPAQSPRQALPLPRRGGPATGGRGIWPGRPPAAPFSPQNIVDWRPFDYVTYHIHTPFGTVVRETAEFTALEGGGTHLSIRCAPPQADNALAQTMARMVMPLVRGKLVRDRRASKVALERVVAEDLAKAAENAA